MVKEKEMVLANLEMEKVMRDAGKMIKEMEKGNIVFLMEIIIMENLKKICLMDKELCFIQMVIKQLECGKIIKEMV